jgi:hypothetical protein
MVGSYYDEDEMSLTWCDIDILDSIEAVIKYEDYNCLFLSWGNGILHRTLKHFKGKKLIIVGEPIGGCTDTMDNDLLNENNFKLVKIDKLHHWYFMNDVTYFYERD